MNTPRKVVTQALFTLLTGAYKFTRAARVPVVPSNVSPSDSPAFFLVKPREIDSEPQAYGAKRYDLLYGALVYIPVDSIEGSTEYLDQIDDIADAIDNALQSPYPGSPQTLGGLVAQCAIDGGMEIVGGGILGQMCALVVPIRIVTGM